MDRMLAPTAPDRMLQLLHPIAGHSTTEWLVFNEHITGWTANRCCCILYVTASVYAAAVRCGGQCDETGLRAVHKRRSIPQAKHGFFDAKHLHISQQCLVEQLHRDRCNFVAVITVCMLAAGEKLEIAWMAQSCEQLEMLRHNGLESRTTFLTIVSFARRQVENPLATGQNRQALTWKIGRQLELELFVQS